ncbi:MAG TPA: acyltransferase [Gammaproteobacteria bacterium]|nr:acyltransferase [Gammaproteobacteria bacterium]
MKIFRLIKKHVLIEIINKSLLLLFPFLTPFFLKLCFGKNNIGKKCRIYTPLILHNTHRNNLFIGNQTHIGRNVLLDLHRKIIIEDRVTISMNTCLITHFDTGESPLKKLGFEAKEGGIMIGDGSYLGANVTVLHGVRIGKNCLIGANSLVNRDIPDNSLVMGSPARVIRTIR